MPTSTDLVTDLPADFEVFGQAVDTDFVDLLGGTTGQVLSKTSATDLDFTWVTANPGDITGVTAGTGISGGGTSGTVTVSIDTAVTADLSTSQTLTNKTLTSPALTTPTISTLTTNGDLVYGTGSGVLNRLGIGSTSQVLTVVSGIPSWSTPASGGSMTLLSTTTLTGATTTISSIDQSYQDLFIIHYGLTNSAADGNQSLKPNNTSSGTFTLTNGPTTFTTFTATELFFMADSNKIKASDANNAWATTIKNYSSSSTYKPFNIVGAFMGANSSRTAISSNGAYESNTAITSITVALSGGGSYSTGTIKIYGVK